MDEPAVYLEKCHHLVASIMSNQPCPVCAQIKDAEDKRGEEVLELLMGYLMRTGRLFEARQLESTYREKYGE